ncbi:hypothetical protein CesoFtcFv8_018027 [Champsocephalus esox]|uniref:Secreted protein n=1 Tax=Champsocephalus esox TaxID=159716 RepID=A0AAN8BLL6_9TELE|nr:hypothetical protein CesoFtcFv8_018027 [Champsocephalus esox]
MVLVLLSGSWFCCPGPGSVCLGSVAAPQPERSSSSDHWKPPLLLPPRKSPLQLQYSEPPPGGTVTSAAAVLRASSGGRCDLCSCSTQSLLRGAL